MYAFGFIMPTTPCSTDEEKFSVDLFSCRKMARNVRLKLPPHLFKCMNLKVKCGNSSLENENHLFTLTSFQTCMTFSFSFFSFMKQKRSNTE